MQHTKAASLSDEQLLSLLLEDDTAAFEEIYHRYWPRLYSMGYKRLNERETVEELIQDLFSSFWLNRHTSNILSLSSYLFAGMKYKVINHLRHESVRQDYISRESEFVNAVDNSTEETLLLHDLQDALDQEIKKLPAACQRVFTLSRQQNLTMKQVAGELGLSEKTVENQLGKAFKVLRANLKHFTFLSVLLCIQ